MIIIPRNNMHLVLSAHLFNAVHVKCIFVLINQIVGTAGTWVNIFYYSIFVMIDICHLTDNLFHGSLFLLFSDLFLWTLVLWTNNVAPCCLNTKKYFWLLCSLLQMSYLILLINSIFHWIFKFFKEESSIL